MTSHTATRKATDLFRARQLAIWALLLSVTATALLLASVGGRIGDLGSPSPSATPASSETPAHSGSLAIARSLP